MFEALAEAIDTTEIPLDSRGLREALRLADRWASKLHSAIGSFDAEGLWALDAAGSMTAWLRHQAGLVNADAHRAVSIARRLQAAPVTRQAWLDGVLTGGQIRAIAANVTDATAGLYAQHESSIVSALVGLEVGDTTTVMRTWAARADALIERDEPAEPDRSLHLSRTLAGRGELRGSFDPEAAEMIATALRLAQNPADAGAGDPPGVGDPPGSTTPTAAQRRADALVALCGWFLDHQHGHRGGRHRPHVNVVVDLTDLEHQGQGRFVDGTPLDNDAIRRLLCDAGVHRVVTAGRSTILDYGRTTRTISPELWAALVIRDRGCRAPWCDRGPDWCHADHIWHWVDDGPTDLTKHVSC